MDLQNPTVPLIHVTQLSVGAKTERVRLFVSRLDWAAMKIKRAWSTSQSIDAEQ